MRTTGAYWREVNIDSGNGQGLSGNKPQPEPMLTQLYVVILNQYATMCWKPLYKLLSDQ